MISDVITYTIPSPTKHRIKYNIHFFILSYVIFDQLNMILKYYIQIKIILKNNINININFNILML